MEPYRTAHDGRLAVKQTQIVRRARRSGGPGDPVDLPVTPASDTSAAARVLATIAAALSE